MGSRIRDNVKHLIQCFCEVVAPQSGGKEPWIIQKFPESYAVEEVLKSIPIFAYPCDFQNTVVQHYSFVLTNVDSKYTFGFCRHDPKTETALVVLSFLPWHETFFKLLNHIAEIIHGKNTDELWRFLDAVYQCQIPDPGNTTEIPFNHGQSKFICQSPNQFQLPSIPENRNLTEYYNAVDTHNMMVIFASMLYERRIIFKSKKLYRLSACVQSANAIIYPMDWQHIYIPVLPMKLMDYLFAPMPYLIGVPEVIYDRVRKNDLGDVVVLDADNNTIETPFQDLESLPTDVVNSLRRHLRNRAALLGDGVSRAFLRSLVQLIGGYRDALRFHQGQRITFNREAFVESRPLSMQPFLRQMLDLQIFQQFIEERLDMLNNGLGFSDEFEMEACSYSEKSSSRLKHQYKEWTYTVKKEGSAFFKTVKKRANPAMKSAVKSVKERGKDVRSAYKDIRSKWRETPADPSRSEGSEKPRSAPTSPTHKRRPQTIAAPKTSLQIAQSYRKGSVRPSKSSVNNNSSSRPYNPLSPVSDVSSPEIATDSYVGTPGFQLSPLDMDLMGDMKDVIFPVSPALENSEADSPPVDRTLKPVRSLESFQSSSYGGSTAESWWLTSAPSPSPPHPVAPQRVRHPVLSRTNHVQPGFTAPQTLPDSTSHSFSTLNTSTNLNFSQILSNSPFSSPSSVDPANVNSSFSPDFPTTSRDLFGATPFVVGGGGMDGDDSLFVDTPPSSVGLVKLPPPTPQHSYRNSKPHDGEDLIRLDSTPDEEFDPILAKDLSSASSSSQRPTTNLRVDQGMSNPLYPYFIPTIGARQPCYDQDSALLRDYGIDFKSLTFQNGNQSSRSSMSPTRPATHRPLATDPFDSLAVFNKDSSSQKLPQKSWTKFD